MPALAVLNTKDKVLGTLDAGRMGTNDGFALDRVRDLLSKHKRKPVHARKVLADGLALAKKAKLHVFVYLSSPT